MFVYLRFLFYGTIALPSREKTKVADEKGGISMKKLSISNQQIRDFASSCYEVIISEIKDVCKAEETESSVTQVEEQQNAA